jgi:hypothetical protein
MIEFIARYILIKKFVKTNYYHALPRFILSFPLKTGGTLIKSAP